MINEHVYIRMAYVQAPCNYVYSAYMYNPNPVHGLDKTRGEENFVLRCCYPRGARIVTVTSHLTSPLPIARATQYVAHNLCSSPFERHRLQQSYINVQPTASQTIAVLSTVVIITIVNPYPLCRKIHKFVPWRRLRNLIFHTRL